MILHNNKPLDQLNEENDLIGILPKAKAIKFFLESGLDSLGDNNMMTLYGGWGSGKTSLVKYLSEELNKKDFRTIFFEPWKHERDSNLAISLLESLADDLKILNSDVFVETIDNVFTKGMRLFKGIIKSSSLTVTSPDGTLSLQINPKAILDETEPKSKEKTFRTKEDEFREAFRELEESIADYANLSKNGKIIVFIDDLDRCDPDKTIELLSTIKLFFTYGNRTIFFCALDKDAVNKAVSKRYGDVIKSEEYLEKIYDITFNMVESNDIRKLIKESFPWDRTVNDIGKNNLSTALSIFFEEIEFTNPRHVKKVLNKYEIIKLFRQNSNSLSGAAIFDLIPDIIVDEEGGNYFDTLLVLYVIVIFEFKRTLFDESNSIEKKIAEYAKATLGTQKQQNGSRNYTNVLDNFNKTIGSQITEFDTVSKVKEKWVKLSSFSNTANNKDNIDHQTFLGFYCRFLPTYTSNNIAMDSNLTLEPFIKQFQSPNNLYAVNFCLYVEKNRGIILEDKVSQYKLERIFKMAKTLL